MYSFSQKSSWNITPLQKQFSHSLETLVHSSRLTGKKKEREASKREDFLMNNPPELGSQWTTSALLQLSCSWDISVQKKKILHNPIGCWTQALDGAAGKLLDSFPACIQSMKLTDSPVGIWAVKPIPGQYFMKMRVCLVQDWNARLHYMTFWTQHN